MKKALFYLQALMLYLIALLPFPLLYLLSNFLYVILYYVAHYRQDVVRGNLANAFPEKTDEERLLIEKNFFKYLSDQMLETAKMLTLSKKSIKKRFRMNNPEVLQDYFDQQKSVLAVTGHYANWEWGSLIVTATYNSPTLIVYKPLSDKSFEVFMNRIRSKFGAVMVPMKGTLRKFIEMKQQTFCGVLVGDQTPVESETQYFTEFLNQKTAVFLGVEKIAKLTGYPVIFCHMNRIKRGYYENTFIHLTDHPKDTADYELTDLHTKTLEEIIRRKPELWLWSHKRWKFQPKEIQEKPSFAG
ncbi:lauroyl acyltransferase [Pedobacter sp. HMF7647]|uniref:Lauroyl acyltransferase n=1 Tax=Hufsiella arboris TaxID=2695275 RepID=A0A7K1Y7E5_9SPHI|nr:lysophospholipid acyltransferase family protein [Hufsiella arboris]MXV50494.1 lauroyl acyltransferase [Hufsiella arboris]